MEKWNKLEESILVDVICENFRKGENSSIIFDFASDALKEMGYVRTSQACSTKWKNIKRYFPYICSLGEKVKEI